MHSPLTAGDMAPDVALSDQNQNEVRLASFRGAPLVVFFYPKANTPGCTTQACALRDALPEFGGAAVVGISPDSPRRQSNFDDKHGLGYPLLSDVDHIAAEAFGVWGEKKLYGKVYMGVIRSAFVIDADGRIVAAFPGVSPKKTVPFVVDALQEITQ